MKILRSHNEKEVISTLWLYFFHLISINWLKMNYSLLFAMKTLLVTISLPNNKEIEVLASRPALIKSSESESVLCYRNNLLNFMFYLIKVSVFNPLNFKIKDYVSHVFGILCPIIKQIILWKTKKYFLVFSWRPSSDMYVGGILPSYPLKAVCENHLWI